MVDEKRSGIKKEPDELAPTIADYKRAISGKRCGFCEHPLTGAIKRYPREDGWWVRGYHERQWLYTTCSKCNYQWSLKYLGVPKDVTAKDLEVKASAMVGEKSRRGKGTEKKAKAPYEAELQKRLDRVTNIIYKYDIKRYFSTTERAEKFLKQGELDFAERNIEFLEELLGLSKEKKSAKERR